MIPFLSFNYQDSLYREQLIEAMTNVLDSKWYIMGKYLDKFEKEYAEFHGVNFALGVANGLDALVIGLKVLEIGVGDEVIVPSNTYIASWLSVSAVGATPVPVEPEIGSYNIDPELIEAAITKNTKAILPVHLYGQSCNMSRIMEIADKYKLLVIEDNAQAHMSSWNGKMTGTFGNINATSFYPGKNFGALGDGGGLTTNDENLYNAAKIYRNYGSDKKYYNQIKGVNSRLDELHAAVLSVKIKYLKELTERRRVIANKYTELLQDCKELQLPYTCKEAEHVFHLYVICCENRDELQAHLSKNNIGTLIHYPVPPHLQIAYKELGYKEGDFPKAERIAKTCLSLPIYPGMLDSEIEEVCNVIKAFYKK